MVMVNKQRAGLDYYTTRHSGISLIYYRVTQKQVKVKEREIYSVMLLVAGCFI
jgi:hypothetical protein